jgi:hypothetical protein
MVYITYRHGYCNNLFDPLPSYADPVWFQRHTNIPIDHTYFYLTLHLILFSLFSFLLFHIFSSLYVSSSFLHVHTIWWLLLRNLTEVFSCTDSKASSTRMRPSDDLEEMWKKAAAVCIMTFAWRAEENNIIPAVGTADFRIKIWSGGISQRSANQTTVTFFFFYRCFYIWSSIFFFSLHFFYYLFLFSFPLFFCSSLLSLSFRSSVFQL